jgi:hypothetical protein
MAKTIRLPSGHEVLVDDRDYESLRLFPWNARRGRHTFYAVYKRPAGDGKYQLVAMHRVVARAEKGQLVDHVNGNGLDNRAANLRICTKRENNRNRQPNAKYRSSPYKGVTFTKDRLKQYRAQINIGGRSVMLGSFATEIEAAQAYDAAAREHYGEFARLNFMSSSTIQSAAPPKDT